MIKINDKLFGFKNDYSFKNYHKKIVWNIDRIIKMLFEIILIITFER